MTNRDAEVIEQEIQRTRLALAGHLDELAERTSPKRAARNFVTSSRGQAVIGGVVGLAAMGVALMVVSRRRKR
ncbi:MAG: DUF3618 domain-containing protein [Mycobacteriales bacterium]